MALLSVIVLSSASSSVVFASSSHPLSFSSPPTSTLFALLPCRPDEADEMLSQLTSEFSVLQNMVQAAMEERYDDAGKEGNTVMINLIPYCIQCVLLFPLEYGAGSIKEGGKDARGEGRWRRL